MQETLDSICKSSNPLGEWIKRQDIQKNTNNNENYLYLVEPGGLFFMIKFLFSGIILIAIDIRII